MLVRNARSRAFYMLTSLQNDHLNNNHHHHLYKFLIIFYWWLCPYVAVSYIYRKQHELLSLFFFFVEYIPWCEKNSLGQIKKKKKIIIYSLSYLLDGQQFFFSSLLFTSVIWESVAASHMHIYIYIYIYMYIFFNI